MRRSCLQSSAPLRPKRVTHGADDIVHCFLDFIFNSPFHRSLKSSTNWTPQTIEDLLEGIGGPSLNFVWPRFCELFLRFGFTSVVRRRFIFVLRFRRGIGNRSLNSIGLVAHRFHNMCSSFFTKPQALRVDRFLTTFSIVARFSRQHASGLALLCTSDFAFSVVITPFPIPDFRHVFTVLVDILLVLDQFILDNSF